MQKTENVLNTEDNGSIPLFRLIFSALHKCFVHKMDIFQL